MGRRNWFLNPGLHEKRERLHDELLTLRSRYLELSPHEFSFVLRVFASELVPLKPKKQKLKDQEPSQKAKT